MAKHILCYGDSNTWGYIAKVGGRYSEDIRWPCVARRLLGEGFRVWENGLNGRTSIFDDPTFPCRNGRAGLDYALLTSKPLDLVVLALGTNDLKFTDVKGSRRGVEYLIQEILSANARLHTDEPIFPNGPHILLLSPIRIHTQVETINPDTHFGGSIPAASADFAQQFQLAVEKFPEISFLDSSVYASPSEEDGVHMDAASHQRLGAAVAEKIFDILGR